MKLFTTKKDAPKGAKTQTKNNTETRALSIIEQATPKKPATRQRLAAALGVDDRTVRYTVENLRRKGHLIISSSHSARGYWIAKDREELDAFLAEYLAHAKQQQQTARAMRRAANK